MMVKCKQKQSERETKRRKEQKQIIFVVFRLKNDERMCSGKQCIHIIRWQRTNGE